MSSGGESEHNTQYHARPSNRPWLNLHHQRLGQRQSTLPPPNRRLRAHTSIPPPPAFLVLSLGSARPRVISRPPRLPHATLSLIRRCQLSNRGLCVRGPSARAYNRRCPSSMFPVRKIRRTRPLRVRVARRTSLSAAWTKLSPSALLLNGAWREHGALFSNVARGNYRLVFGWV